MDTPYIYMFTALHGFQSTATVGISFNPHDEIEGRMIGISYFYNLSMVEVPEKVYRTCLRVLA